MPIIPSSLSNINSKVNSARKTFNSSLDKAGEKSGIFKPSSTSNNNKQNLNSSNQTSGGAPAYQPKTRAPPPPPPRRYDSNQTNSSNTSVNQNYGPPPPVAPPPRYLNPSTSNTSLNQNYGPPPPPPRRTSTTSNTSLNQNYGPPPPAPPRRLTSNPSSNSLNQNYGPPPPPRRLTPNPSNNSLNQTYEPPPAVSAKPILSSYSRPPLPTSNAAVPQTKFESNPPNPTYLQPGLKKSSIPYPPFSKFTESDKLSFFALLDEFFNVQSDSINQTNVPSRSLSSTPPPPISIHNKPKSNLNQFEAKYPTTMSSKDVASYFLNHHSWNANQDQWYTSPDPIPNPLLNLTDIKRMSSWRQTGSIRHQFNYVLFSDLSQLWSSIIFNTERPFPPQEVQVKYRLTPSVKNTNQLISASETYSHHLLQYLEGVEHHQRHVGRGECWDLANEALKTIPSLAPHLPLPLTSINRTHGWLLYHGEANGVGNGVGHWLPESMDEIRPGDVIEWKLVSCNTINPTLMCKLGDPEHTAMILDVQSSNITNRFIPPSQLGHITVLEQSLKQLPIRRTYDLSTMSAGSVWIYRPDSEKNLLGLSANSCDWPPKGFTLSS